MRKQVIPVLHRDIMERDLEKVFNAAISVIQSLPKDGEYKPPPEMLLRYYANYKRATVGACNLPKPWAFDVVGKAKWDAWNSVSHLSKEEAMQNYVDEVTKVYSDLPSTPEKTAFGELIGFKEGNSDETHHVEKPQSLMAVPIPETEGSSMNHNPTSVTQMEKLDSICSDTDEEFCDPQVIEHQHKLTPQPESSSSRASKKEDSKVISAKTSPPIKHEATANKRSGGDKKIIARLDALKVDIKKVHSTLLTLEKAKKEKLKRKRGKGEIQLIRKMFFPGMAWRSIFFILVWPLILNFALRRLKK